MTEDYDDLMDEDVVVIDGAHKSGVRAYDGTTFFRLVCALLQWTVASSALCIKGEGLIFSLSEPPEFLSDVATKSPMFTINYTSGCWLGANNHLQHCLFQASISEHAVKSLHQHACSQFTAYMH